MTQIVEELYAYVADDDGIVAGFVPGVGATPLVCTSMRVADMMRPIADAAVERSGKTVRLVRYSLREVVRVIEP